MMQQQQGRCLVRHTYHYGSHAPRSSGCTHSLANWNRYGGPLMQRRMSVAVTQMLLLCRPSRRLRPCCLFGDSDRPTLSGNAQIYSVSSDQLPTSRIWTHR
mmetsp:Transcript_2042/g.4927  ORF Transcript_2042/g.4927 Transcript_2042/m.4927 type:complete len:101 (-) Transcript_2042:1297-1599(-)